MTGFYSAFGGALSRPTSLEGSAMGMRFVGLDLRDILSLGYQDLPVANLRKIMNVGNGKCIRHAGDVGMRKRVSERSERA